MVSGHLLWGMDMLELFKQIGQSYNPCSYDKIFQATHISLPNLDNHKLKNKQLITSPWKMKEPCNLVRWCGNLQLWMCYYAETTVLWCA
jgi:hypothetical protein